MVGADSTVAPVAFVFDDSLVKMDFGILRDSTASGASSVASTEYYLTSVGPVDLANVTHDGDHRIIAMSKEGCGTKQKWKWFKEEVDYDGDNSSHPSTKFWQSQYKKCWINDFLCDPKILAAHDVMETLFMRLSFYLRNEGLLQTLQEGAVYFGPFTLFDGAYDLSYHSLCWYVVNLGDAEDKQIEQQWCEYAMEVVERDYLRELVELGYGERSLMDIKVFREEIMLYLTTLSSQVNRNNMVHIFSTSVKQVWMKSQTYVKGKNRCLLDEPAPALSDGYKKKLISVLDDLGSDMPNEFQTLRNIFPMQVFFLKTVLQKPVGDGVLPRPTKLPRTLPPPIKG